MNMKELQDQLEQWSNQNGMAIKNPSEDNKKNKKKSEKLSKQDLRELMGTDRDTYCRRGGAIRRK